MRKICDPKVRRHKERKKQTWQGLIKDVKMLTGDGLIEAETCREMVGEGANTTLRLFSVMKKIDGNQMKGRDILPVGNRKKMEKEHFPCKTH